MKRTIIASFLICGAAMMLCTSCADKEKVKEKLAQQAAYLHKTQTADPVTVKVITAGSEEFTSSSNFVGRVEPSKSALVISPYPGTLLELNAVKGRKVAKGTVIAKVDSESLRSAYEIAKSTLEQAQDGYDRVEKVYGNGSVTEVKMVEIRTKLEQAKAAEKAARQALDECEIKAPFSGVIGEVYCQKGELLTAAAPVVQILDVESVEIHFSVPEKEYSHIALGDKAEVEIPALDRTVTGSVAVKGISASPLSHAYDFTLKNIDDSRSLMPGMVCKVRVKSESDSMLVIPASAVMTDMEGRYIWGVDENDKVCKTYVTVGGYADKGIIVSEGIEEGDRIIVEGSRKVSTGMKVKVEE